MQIIYSYRNEARVCTQARGKKRLLGMMDNEYVYYLDYGDGFINIYFKLYQILCIKYMQFIIYPADLHKQLK